MIIWTLLHKYRKSKDLGETNFVLEDILLIKKTAKICERGEVSLLYSLLIPWGI
jgi:hypothetical protein